jgi:hypothetical protein
MILFFSHESRRSIKPVLAGTHRDGGLLAMTCSCDEIASCDILIGCASNAANALERGEAARLNLMTAAEKAPSRRPSQSVTCAADTSSQWF